MKRRVKCAKCGKKFSSAVHNKAYCSKRCQSAARYSRLYAKYLKSTGEGLLLDTRKQ